MSMELMVKAMKTVVGNPLRKLVLIKLADNASDQGECWPSYQHIAEQCEISKRSVMNHIDALIEAGFVTKELRKGGPKGNYTNVYRLHLGGAGVSLRGSAGAASGVVQEIHQGSAGDALPPSESPAPRTSHSSEPVIEPEQGACAPRAKAPKFDPLTARPANVSLDAWADWCEHRREIRKPLTAASCRHQAKQLANHPNPDHVLHLSIANGWTGLFPEKSHASSQHSRAASRSSAVDQVREAIAARAAAEAAPGLAGQPVAEDDRDVRPPLDGEFRRVR